MEGPAIQTPSDELGNADWDRLCEMIPLLPEDRRFVNSLCILHREGRAIALFLKSSTDTKEMLKRCAQTADKLAEMLQTINQSLFAAFSDAQIELVDHPLVYFVGVARELQLLSFRLKASIS